MRQKVTVLEHLTTLALKVLANTAGKISDLASTTASAMLELKNEVTTAAKTAEADKVTFADGETFQAKYNAGKLTGPTPTVKAVEAGTIGTPGTPTVTASQSGNTVTLTFDHLKGATGAPGSNANVTGGASSIVTANLTAGRALVSDANGKVAVSDITSAVLAFLSGVTSNVQAQLNAKQNKLTGNAGQVVGFGEDKTATPMTLTKANVGLGQVDNTPDSAKNVAKATEAGHATAADTATNATQLGGHPADYFAPMKTGKSRVSFTDAAINAGIDVSRHTGIDGIERFVSKTIPGLKQDTSDIIMQAGDGPIYSLWYYYSDPHFYCGIIMDYFTDLKTYRFSYYVGEYAVREL